MLNLKLPTYLSRLTLPLDPSDVVKFLDHSLTTGKKVNRNEERDKSSPSNTVK